MQKTGFLNVLKKIFSFKDTEQPLIYCGKRRRWYIDKRIGKYTWKFKFNGFKEFIDKLDR